MLVQCCQNFVALRLADVLGPLDNTDRWINYMLWLLASDLVPGLAVHLPRSAQHRRLSLVFRWDIVLSGLGRSPPPRSHTTIATHRPKQSQPADGNAAMMWRIWPCALPATQTASESAWRQPC